MANPYNIFLIDDDPDDHEIFLSVVTGIMPASVCRTAVNGEEGIELLMKSLVTPDIIFLDLNMPLMNGMQFLVEFKKISTINIPVVILSTSSNPALITATKNLGAIDFITKPDRYSDWERVLSKVLMRERPSHALNE